MIGCVTDSMDMSLSKLQEILYNGDFIENLNDGVRRASRLVNTLRCWEVTLLERAMEASFSTLHHTAPSAAILFGCS